MKEERRCFADLPTPRALVLLLVGGCLWGAAAAQDPEPARAREDGVLGLLRREAAGEGFLGLSRELQRKQNEFGCRVFVALGPHCWVGTWRSCAGSGGRR